MSLKDNYLELIKKLNKSPEKPVKPYALTKKGVSRSIIKSILQGSDVGIHNVYVVAKALNVPIEALYPGIEQTEKVVEIAEGYATDVAAQCSFLVKFGPLSKEEKELLVKTLEVWRGTNRNFANILETTINGLHQPHNYMDVEEGASDTQKKRGNSG